MRPSITGDPTPPGKVKSATPQGVLLSRRKMEELSQWNSWFPCLPKRLTKLPNSFWVTKLLLYTENTIKGYCGLNANVEILSPSVMGSGSRVCGRCRGHKGGALMNGMSAFIKETQESSVTLSACEDTVRSVCESGARSSPDTRPAATWPWTSLASRTVRNECVVSKPTSLWDPAIATPKDPQRILL